MPRRRRGLGVEPGERNTQSVVNVRLNRWFGWDGANDNLWAQSIRPLTAPYMHDGSLATLCELLRRHPAEVALTAAEGDDLRAFLDTLTEADARRFAGADGSVCR